VGPDTELEYWRNRMAKFNSITEQLKSKECKLVLGVAMAGRSKVGLGGAPHTLLAHNTLSHAF